jgi:hypothetical protein
MLSTGRFEMNSNKKLAVLLLAVFFLISGAYGGSVSVGRGSSVAVSEGSSAEGILTSDGSVTQSSVSSVGVIDDLNIDPWVQDTNGDYAEIGVTGTNVAGFTYSDNYYPVKDQVGVSDAVWAQQWIGASSADSLNAYSRASNSAGDRAGTDLNVKYGSVKGYYNAAYAGPAPWLGMDHVASVQQILDSANGNEILATTWAVDSTGDATGASTDVKQGSLYGYSVLADAARYSSGLNAAGVSVDSMSASSTSGSINQIMAAYDSKGDISTVSLDDAKSLTAYDGKAYAYNAIACATETGQHITGSFVGTAKVGTATKTRTPNFGSEYDLSMAAITGSAPTGNLGYYINPTIGIKKALDIAEWGDAINLAAGTYKENVKIDKSVTIRGAGATSTIVDGSNAGTVFDIGRNNANVDVTLSGMTIQNGLADYGGAIFNYGRLEIIGSTISGNTATTGGAGIFNEGIATITGSTISGNTAGSHGGGVYNYRDPGDDVTDGTLTIRDSTISGNKAGDHAGGIFNEGTGNANIINSRIIDNTAIHGGGISNVVSGILTLTDCTISGNKAGWGGGIFNYDQGKLFIGGTSQIINNQATAGEGGGIYTGNSLVTLDGTTVAIKSNKAFGPVSQSSWYQGWGIYFCKPVTTGGFNPATQVTGNTHI